jgi:hypothetical protein
MAWRSRTVALVGVMSASIFCIGWQQARLFAQSSLNEISFEKMSGAQEFIEMDYQSNGCFHGDHYVLRYESQPAPHIRVKKMPLNNKMPGQDVAEVTLTPQQVVRLDNLLRFYRQREEGAARRVRMCALFYGTVRGRF